VIFDPPLNLRHLDFFRKISVALWRKIFLAKNSPAKNHPSKELSGEELSGEEIS
jgi:hypothetical protein